VRLVPPIRGGRRRSLCSALSKPRPVSGPVGAALVFVWWRLGRAGVLVGSGSLGLGARRTSELTCAGATAMAMVLGAERKRRGSGRTRRPSRRTMTRAIRQDAPPIAESEDEGDGPGQRRCRSKPVKGSFLLVPSRCRFDGDLKTSVMSLFLGWIFVRIRISTYFVCPTSVRLQQPPWLPSKGARMFFSKSLRDRDRGATNWPPWKNNVHWRSDLLAPMFLCLAREGEWTRQPPQVEGSNCQGLFW
jgi:hypothetical protein